jgi:23S rRNA pseudouridine2605 synthase
MAKRAQKSDPRDAVQEGTRLNKVIADAGVASRRAADGLIAEGRVRVNGRVVTELGMRVTPNDQIAVDGKIIGLPERHVYLLMNKPKDTITTTSDERGRRTVLDLIDQPQRLYPVGRLDRNTTGALLLTNDGDLAHRLMHPRFGIERYYEVELDRPIAFADAKAIARGNVDLGNGDVTGQCEIFVDDRDRRQVTIMLREGKNREVRRLFEAFEYNVEKLNRRAYAGLTTRGLARGEWRHLERNEVAALRHLVGL